MVYRSFRDFLSSSISKLFISCIVFSKPIQLSWLMVSLCLLGNMLESVAINSLLCHFLSDIEVHDKFDILKPDSSLCFWCFTFITFSSSSASRIWAWRRAVCSWFLSLHSSNYIPKHANSSIVFYTFSLYYSRSALVALSSVSKPSLLFSISTISLLRLSHWALREVFYFFKF